jgi:hypothetical protein
MEHAETRVSAQKNSTERKRIDVEVRVDSRPSLDELKRVETGFARLYQSEHEVFKLRRPVRLAMGDERVDLSSLELRRAACLEEQRIDEQLAPGVARGVVAIAADAAGRLRVDGESAPVDWALRMRRMPDADRAADRLAAGRLDDEDLQAVARCLARFHERARGVSAGPEEMIEALRRRVTLRIDAPDWPRRTPLPEDVDRIESWQLAFLEREVERLTARARADAIREGHGELTLEHVFIDDARRVRILAGLEIGPRFRDTDVAADVALLATDLAGRHRADLAERFVAEYARLANDFDLYPLLDFFASLRASIRAKLDWLCADREAAGSKGERRYRGRARRFFALALAAPRRPLLPPAVVAMGGLVASGKSTVALHIARRIGAPVVGSDPVRDFLLGARLNEDLHEARWEKSYEPGFGERVYCEALRRASEVLASGRPVVIDGCFRSRAQRLRARALAERFGLPFLFVEARISPDCQRQRLAERAVRDSVTVDDWQEIADQMSAQWEPADELSESEHLALDTGLALERNAATIEQRLPTWPPSLTG